MSDYTTAEEPGTAQATAAKGLDKYIGAEAQRKALDNMRKRDYCLERGHARYVEQAYTNNHMYLGRDLQWAEEDREALADEDRRAVEDNHIMRIVNTASGYQIQNRMDIGIRPRGRGADDETALSLQKVIKKICDDVKLHWKESEVFQDGVIEQRGYFDVRVSFEENIYGDVTCDVLDPRLVMPCPDAQTYDPDGWPYVLVDSYLTLDEIEARWGIKARKAMEYMTPSRNGAQWDMDSWRSRFGTPEGDRWSEWYINNDGTDYYLVVTKQYKTFELTRVAVYPHGDVRQIPNATPEQIAAYKRAGAIITKRPVTRWKFLVTSCCGTLFDDYSPYPWCTIVPYFPHFRRGMTRGLVDNAISVQRGLNKAMGQLENIIDHVSNSGWFVWENSLANLSTKAPGELKKALARNGALIVVKQGFEIPKKIEPPQLPQGIVEIIQQNRAALANIIGEVLDNGGPTNEMSGVAYQARMYAAQQKLVVPLDNLARTRHMLAIRFVDCVQMFYDTPRVIRITEEEAGGAPTTSELEINVPLVDGSYLNDLTIGEYDIVIAEQPMQNTFDNSQFEQVMRMIEAGIPIPPRYVLRYSNLAEKNEIAKAAEEASQQQPDPEIEAKVEKLLADVALVKAKTVNERITSAYSATQAAVQVTTYPQAAGVADEILQSGGFEDQNPAPIIPQLGAGLASVAPPVPTTAPLTQGGDPSDPSTNPGTPERPTVGINAGIEKPGPQEQPNG